MPKKAGLLFCEGCSSFIRAVDPDRVLCGIRRPTCPAGAGSLPYQWVAAVIGTLCARLPRRRRWVNLARHHGTADAVVSCLVGSSSREPPLTMGGPVSPGDTQGRGSIFTLKPRSSRVVQERA
jgi:hypothetical protein